MDMITDVKIITYLGKVGGVLLNFPNNKEFKIK